MYTGAALVLLMTIPALAIFYAGMVSSKNVLAVCMQTVSICCLVTILWMAFGYSLVYCPVGNYVDNDDHKEKNNTLVFGDSCRLWLRGLDISTVHQLYPSVPEAAYCLFELTFAIITPCLICGSIADRMRYWNIHVYYCYLPSYTYTIVICIHTLILLSIYLSRHLHIYVYTY